VTLEVVELPISECENDGQNLRISGRNLARKSESAHRSSTSPVTFSFKRSRKRFIMKALVYHGPGSMSWDEVPNPTLLADTDIIVRVDVTTICGTDLHILKGDTPEVTAGRILGHEAVGTVTQVGSGVKTRSKGDRVLVSCITACGACRFCREGRYGQCLGGGGWILGHLIDGTQAEFVRVPFADTSTYLVPKNVADEDILMLADILPTGYEVGVLNGHVQPGDTVAVVGAGPIGLAAITGARMFHRATSSQSTWQTRASRPRSASAPTSRLTTLARTRSPTCRASPTAWASTSPSKRSVCRPVSNYVPRSCAPEVTWPTSACTASPRRCT